MRVSTAVAAAVVLVQLLPAAGFANDQRDPGPSRSGERAGGGEGSASGGQPAPPSQPSVSRPPGSGSERHRDRGGRHRSTRGGWYVGPGWGGWGGWGGWWGWDPFWSGGYGYGYGHGYGYGPRFSYTQVYPDPAARHGALDIDVSPERAEVWVDGERVGVADDFDGFPSYLWLERGTYDVVLYLDGYTTLARQYTIYPGLVIDVEDLLARGASVHPRDLGPKSTVNRDERLRRDREAQDEAARRASEGSGNWSPRSSRDESLDARGEPARVRLEVLPEDASVYLDGRFLGTGRELARLRAGLLIDPGSHTLEVVRPGYAPERRTLEVEAGSDQEVEVELEAGG